MSEMPGIGAVPLPWQADAWQALVARLAGGNLPHGILVTGQAGLGKTLFAAAFARLALCRNPEPGRACGRCSSCVQYAAGTHPDFRHVSFEEREGKAGEEGGLKSAISVEQAPADKGPSLPFEVNRVRGDHVLNGVAVLEGSRVDSPRRTDVRGDKARHGCYPTVGSNSGGTAYSQRDGWRRSSLPGPPSSR